MPADVFGNLISTPFAEIIHLRKGVELKIVEGLPEIIR
jgi:hypothetical protein